MVSFKLIDIVFKSTCTIATCTLVGYWFYNYSLDEDISLVEFNSYYDTESDVFPVMSMCFEQSFDSVRFQKYGQNINGSTYKKYLAGDYFESNMTKIDYDNVTTKISDFLIGTNVVFKIFYLVDKQAVNRLLSP